MRRSCWVPRPDVKERGKQRTRVTGKASPLRNGFFDWAVAVRRARHPGPADLIKLCGAKGNRTPDLLDANETRYQLRYSP
jgi:hypothetical protein